MTGLATKQFYIVVTLAFIALVLNAAIPIFTLNLLKNAGEEALAVRKNTESLDNLLLNMVNAETGSRGYVITGNANFLEPYFNAQESINVLLPQLRHSLTLENVSASMVQKLEDRINDKLSRLKETIAARELAGVEKASSMIMSGEGKKRMSAVRDVIKELRLIESDKVRNLELRQDQVGRYTNMVLILLTVIDLILFSIAFIFLLKSLKASKLTQENLNLLNAETLRKSELLALKNSNKTIQARLNEVLQTVHNPEEAYAAVANYCGHLFPQYSGAFYIKSNSKDYFDLKASWGNIKSVEGFEPHACWAVRKNGIYRFDHLARDLPCQHIAEMQFERLSVCIPVASSDEMIGILNIFDPAPTGEEVMGMNEYLESLALEVVGHIGLAITNLRLRETLKNSAIVDVLTGLFNRRYLNETLTRELARAERAKQPVGIIMLDVDRFKLFNDIHGHEAGDLVLKEIGLLLKRLCRTSDIACRYGGEEFVLVLPEASVEIAQQRAETIRNSVKNITLVYGGTALPVIAVSVGVSVFPDDGAEAEVVLKAADDALYHAKRNGRDQVHVYLRS